MKYFSLSKVKCSFWTTLSDFLSNEIGMIEMGEDNPSAIVLIFSSFPFRSFARSISLSVPPPGDSEIHSTHAFKDFRLSCFFLEKSRCIYRSFNAVVCKRERARSCVKKKRILSFVRSRIRSASCFHPQKVRPETKGEILCSVPKITLSEQEDIARVSITRLTRGENAKRKSWENVIFCLVFLSKWV